MGRLTVMLTPGRIGGLVSLVLFIVLRFWDPMPLAALRNSVFDWYQIVTPRLETEYPVRIIDIDDKSLRELGQWPWSRAVVAALVDKLAEQGATVLGFDILFAEPDRLSPARFAEATSLDERLRGALALLPDNDVTFAAALSRTRSVLGQAGLTGHSEGGTTAAAPRTALATLGGDPRRDLVQFPKLLTSLPVLEAAASGHGLVTVLPDPDGVIRRVPVVASAADTVVPALSIEVIRVARGATTILVKRDEAGMRSVVVAGVEIPTDRDGQLWLHYGLHDRRRYISSVDVLRDRVPAHEIAGKLVLLGTSAVGLFDLRATPVDGVMPGVEIHAQMIESILAGVALSRPNYALGAEIVLAVATGIGIVVAIPMLGALPTLLVGGLLALLFFAGSWFLFVHARVLVDITYPMLSGGTIFLLLAFLNYRREERRRTWIRDAFRQYLSPDLVEQLSRSPERLVLGGEARVMTVLFSDVRGFTAIAESFKANPSGLTVLMNRLLTPLSKAVIERRGTIDKYMGDAVMAFWNAPLDDVDHAANACAAGLEILRRLDRLNAERLEEAKAAGHTATLLEIGVGISTGVCVVGNMGSDIRFDYSVLGDSVNTASRLEGLAAHYGVRLLISSTTAAACAGRFAVLEIDCVRLKGKAEDEAIFALLGEADLLAKPDFLVFRDTFDDMLRHYRVGETRKAKEALDRCRRGVGFADLDGLIGVYERRIADLELGVSSSEGSGSRDGPVGR